MTGISKNGKAHLPCDFRFYNPAQDGLTKNDRFQNMLKNARERGFVPELVAFDSWYTSLENLKLVRTFGWHWLTQLKKNRLLSLDRSGDRPVSEWLISSHGQKMHLKGYGWVKVFKTVAKDGSYEYWATSKLDMTLEECAFRALDAWQIEVYHRGLKQNTGVKRISPGPPHLACHPCPACSLPPPTVKCCAAHYVLLSSDSLVEILSSQITHNHSLSVSLAVA